MKVFFAVPSYAGIRRKECLPFVTALEETLKLCRERGHVPTIALQEGCVYIQTARNELVKQFMDSGAECLFFLDDDVDWKPEDALRLIEMPDAMVAGIYCKKAPTEEYPVVIFTDEQHRPIVRNDGCIRGRLLPTGFLRIQRSVFEKLRAAHPELEYEKEEGGETFCDLFPQGVVNRRWWGEDFAFCRLWDQLGGESWIVPNLTLIHWGKDKDGKPKPYVGNYHEFLMRCPGGSKHRSNQ